MKLKNHTLFITGASRGIGLAIALRAARDGANIAIAAKTATPHPKLPGTIFSAAEAIDDVTREVHSRPEGSALLRNSSRKFGFSTTTRAVRGRCASSRSKVRRGRVSGL